MSLKIKSFDYRNAGEGEFQAFNDCRNQLRAERLPDDPPQPLEEMTQALNNLPDYVELHIWTAEREPEGTVAAYGLVQMSNADNLHAANFNIAVLPGFRRQGLGRQLLANIVRAAKTSDRRLLITDTYARIPAGEAFMDQIGGSRGIEGHTNQLTINDLAPQLLENWVKKAHERAADFETGLWEGPYPQADMEAIVALHDLLNQQPFGDLDIEDFNFNEDHIRQNETALFARGYRRWTLFVREKNSGNFAGYTEIFWNPNNPAIVHQGMTGVFPEYRNRGLGRWIKAEMLIKMLQELPQAKFVRTDNADMNAPMMKINNELGFKPYMADCVWQVDTAQAARYLSGELIQA